uniref:Uncharacterized protein n=1 Tax=Anopheles stephensi TaxID=30069 RepID=A0A182XV17_ANOST
MRPTATRSISMDGMGRALRQECARVQGPLVVVVVVVVRAESMGPFPGVSEAAAVRKLVTVKTVRNGTAGRTGPSSAASTGSKSFLSRLRQFTGRLSFNFDSRESKKLQLLAANAPDRVKSSCAGVPARDHQHRLEKSRTVDVGDLGPVAICGDGTMSTGQQQQPPAASVSSTLMVHQHHAAGLVPGESFYGGGPPVVMNQPKSISPILMQHRHSEVLGLGGPAAARSRAYSLDVPIGGRHCCRSLSGSTTGGGAGSSCGGSHKSLTFSLNNRSLTEDNDGGGSLALVSSDRKSGVGAAVRNGTDHSFADDPSCAIAGNDVPQQQQQRMLHHTNSSYEPSLQGILLTSTSLQADSPQSQHRGGPVARTSLDSERRAPFAESESISSKHTSALVSYWICLTERMSSLICKCCERTLPPAESV